MEYDGTDYHGFQIQPTTPTIQGALEAALSEITQGYDEGAPGRITGAGRTDAGVHAVGQVIHFDSLWARSSAELQRALNAILPSNIVVRDLAIASDGFHARFSACRRKYVYSVFYNEERSPLRERYAFRVRGKISLVAMNEAASYAIGTRDFAALGQPPSGLVTIRTVYRADWTRRQDGTKFVVVANAYLRRMVRRLVGTLLRVGQGTVSVREFEDILLEGDISRAAPPVPPCGLRLEEVYY